jgi:hypothetical protein
MGLLAQDVSSARHGVDLFASVRERVRQPVGGVADHGSPLRSVANSLDGGRPVGFELANGSRQHMRLRKRRSAPAVQTFVAWQVILPAADVACSPARGVLSPVRALFGK